MADQPLAHWPVRDVWQDAIGQEIIDEGRFGAEGAPGVTVELLAGRGFATLIAPPGAAGLAPALKRLTGLDLPGEPVAALSDAHGVIWSGPGRWLLTARRRAGFPALLTALGAVAAVSDQSHGRAALRLSGPHLCAMLAKGVMIDLHPAAFAVHATAMTAITHVNVQLWRCPDGADGPVFELVVARSLAGSLWSWLAASVAEFGCAVRPAGA